MMRTRPWSRIELAASRVLDLVIASLLLVVALPLMFAIALLVRSTSSGPVLYTHQRVGAGGVPFQMRKFRTMVVGTDREIQANPEQWAAFAANAFKLTADDPRITRVGRFLRKTSLDELPQLLDVIAGSMSLVGIRPVEPAQLATRSPDYQAMYRLRRPGITGLWQVEGRSSVDDAGRLRLDSEYMANWSVGLDLRLLMRTPFAVFHLHLAH